MTSAATSPMSYEDQGTGDPVVMIHGLGGSSNSFQALMPALSGWRILRPDLPGAGLSPARDASLSIASHAEAVLAMLQGCGIQRAHFVGHSMGTLVCQMLAASRPEMVASLALFGALTVPPDAARSGLIARAATARRDGMRGIADQVAMASTSAQSLHDNPAAAAFVRETLSRQDPQGYALNCEALARAEANDWAAITAACLLVTGDSDPVSPPSMAHLLSERLRLSTLHILTGCGHWSIMERPQETARLLSDFLKKH